MNFQLHLCTANLGATSRSSGHPKLKHCYAMVTDGTGAIRESWSMGRQGVSEESHPNVPSTHCETVAQNISLEQIDQFSSAFHRCGDRPYKWGENDCCSSVSYAAQSIPGLSLPNFIQKAQSDIALSEEIH